MDQNLPEILKKVQKAVASGNAKSVQAALDKPYKEKPLKNVKNLVFIQNMVSALKKLTKEITHLMVKGKDDEAREEIRDLDTGAREMIPERTWNKYYNIDED